MWMSIEELHKEKELILNFEVDTIVVLDWKKFWNITDGQSRKIYLLKNWIWSSERLTSYFRTW